MTSDFEIGRVVTVDSAQVTIELNPDLRGLTRSTYEGVQEIGRINSYVVLPVGARRLVGIVTKVVLTEEAELRADRTSVTLPASRRLMKATLVGTIDVGSFSQGVSTFPTLDNPVHVATKQDLDAIFDSDQEMSTTDPGFCIQVGTSALFEGYPINLDPDAFFGKHAAVLGSTGSGKSSTIASLIQAILEREEVKRTSIVILDTNGEYSEALKDTAGRSTLVIPSDPLESEQRLVIPYWFMNSNDFIRLFQASPGVQRPVLLRALQAARSEASPASAVAILRQELSQELLRILITANKDDKVSKDVQLLADGLITYMADSILNEPWQSLEAKLPTLDREKVRAAVEQIKTEAEKYIDNNTYPRPLPVDARHRIQTALDPLLDELAQVSLEGKTLEGSADRPAYFDKQRFRHQHVEQVLRQDESGARARDYSATMLLRMDQLLADRRFDFLLGSEQAPFPDAEHSLAAFIRDIVGLPGVPSSRLSDEAQVPKGRLPFYDRQRGGAGQQNVVIVDLSLLTSEGLENVTALIGRLILDFLQRLGETRREARGSLPIVLVLEEAQNYIRERRHSDDESIAREVFERIAREGRKYGLGLVVASQRPSELSKTVLSQCSSFIVHRLQNPDDLSYFRQIVPTLFAPLLEQLPALPPQTALMLGEAVRAPALVRIRDANPVPRSRDPKFYRRWVVDTPAEIDVEGIAADWEGKSVAGLSAQSAPKATQSDGQESAGKT